MLTIRNLQNFQGGAAMSELLKNATQRREILKHMILQLHEGTAPEQVKQRLAELLQKIPYGEVVEVEQELIAEGLPQEEVLRLCDVHTQVLEGRIDLSGTKTVPEGHPVDTFRRENRELSWQVNRLKALFQEAKKLDSSDDVRNYVVHALSILNNLMDVDKHYRRKENLLFPYLEKHGITGPPTVMWGKHDETRQLLKDAIQALHNAGDIAPEAAQQLIETRVQPAAEAVSGMVMKEEEILFPMTLDTLTEAEWYDIYRQTPEIGFCLYDPDVEWKPEGVTVEAPAPLDEEGRIQLSSGSFTPKELETMLNSLPIDMTFVDKDDNVRYFTQGKERIFDRNRAILQRNVKLCHPPSSVHVVETILDDFKSGKASSAPFWIQLGDKFIHIEYFALRDTDGNYLGTLEVSQDLTEKRQLEGEQRLLSYSQNK